MEIEHKGDQSTLQTSAGTTQHIEARAGDLRAAFKINNAEGRAKIPVGFRLEVKLLLFSHRPQDDIIVLVLSKRCVWIGDVRNTGCNRI